MINLLRFALKSLDTLLEPRLGIGLLSDLTMEFSSIVVFFLSKIQKKSSLDPYYPFLSTEKAQFQIKTSNYCYGSGLMPLGLLKQHLICAMMDVGSEVVILWS